MDFLQQIFAFYFGCIVGSFLNVVILRLPEDEKLTGRSHCPNCKHTLHAGELVPLFSFLALGRKCRNCGKRISWRYFIIECVTGVLFLAAWLFINPVSLISGLVVFKFFVVLSLCLVCFMIDFEHYIIVIPVIITGLVLLLGLNLGIDLIAGTLLATSGQVFTAIAGGIIGAIPLYFLWFASVITTGKTGRWMGLGDGTLMLFLGASVGLRLVGVALMLSIFLGGLFSVLLLLLGKKSLASKLPFGTFLTIGTALTLFYGPQILHWYLSFLGF